MTAALLDRLYDAAMLFEENPCKRRSAEVASAGDGTAEVRSQVQWSEVG
jgi:hypothetical protein